ncbi:Ig-like domain-containing protein [Deinococcus sp. YIM 77859]|uniref:Ig-like domain-containing protein n=1 Tax=Deinococcus sp. YIM 77859 TaxID=1540221 RepID=UPI00054EF60A|nr:Ig-like domain-containing protein [Deinococcus sp. YIM 77859]
MPLFPLLSGLSGRLAATTLLTAALLVGCSTGPSQPAPGPGQPPGAGDTIQPTLTLTSPADNSSASGSLLLQGEVSDQGGLARLTYRFNNGNEQALTLPADGKINTVLCLCGLQPGTYTLTVTAYDTAGNSTQVTRTVTVLPLPGGGTADTTAPTFTLTAPTNGASVPSPVRVTGTASDNQTIARITYQLDGAAEIDLPVTPGPTVNLDVTLPNITAGTHTLTVRAYDAAGNRSEAASASFTVTGTSGDTVAPTVTITAPTNGATVPLPVRILAAASDNQAVARFTYQLDNGPAVHFPVAPGQNASLDVSLSDVPAGPHTLTVVAYDTAGNRSNSASVTFTVATGGGSGDVTAPTVNLTSPAAGSTVNNPVQLTGTASDNRAVTRLTYTLDGGAETNLNITPGTNVTFNTALPTLSAGTHTLTVTAYDAAGNRTSSPSVTFTVAATQPASPQPLVGTGYSVNSGTRGLCLLCTVENDANVVNTNLTDEASLKVSVGVAGHAYLRVIGTEQRSAGQVVGFAVRRPGGLLDLGVLTNLTLVTYLNGQPQETRSGASVLDLALLTPGSDIQTVAFRTSQPFDSVELRLGGVVEALTELRVLYAFVK